MTPDPLTPVEPDTIFMLSRDFEAQYPIVATTLRGCAAAWSAERSDLSRYRIAYRAALELLQRALLMVPGWKRELEEFLKDKHV